MNTFECEFCKSNFSTKSNLSNHKRRTKKCLMIQNNINNKNLFHCYSCGKDFTSKQNMLDHSSNCKVKYTFLEQKYILLEKKYEIVKIIIDEKDKQIQKQDEQIKILQKQLSNIAEIGTKKNTTINNNHIKLKQNIINKLSVFDITKEKIKEIVNEKFTENHLHNPETRNVAIFAVEHILKDENGQLKMVCTDTSRKMFACKDENGNIYKDPNANSFTNMYMIPLHDKAAKLISSSQEFSEDMINGLIKIQDIKNNPSILASELSDLLG
jgi:hypothetical protein